VAMASDMQVFLMRSPSMCPHPRRVRPRKLLTRRIRPQGLRSRGWMAKAELGRAAGVFLCDEAITIRRVNMRPPTDGARPPDWASSVIPPTDVSPRPVHGMPGVTVRKTSASGHQPPTTTRRDAQPLPATRCSRHRRPAGERFFAPQEGSDGPADQRHVSPHSPRKSATQPTSGVVGQRCPTIKSQLK
jgi:hypothetical protein